MKFDLFKVSSSSNRFVSNMLFNLFSISAYLYNFMFYNLENSKMVDKGWLEESGPGGLKKMFIWLSHDFQVSQKTVFINNSLIIFMVVSSVWVIYYMNF